MFPVIFPEECVEGSWRRVLPACRPVYINDTLAGLSPAAEPGAEAARPRSGICLQGKLDQSRRDYTGIFAQLQEQAEELAASNFTLVIQVLGVGVGLQVGAGITVDWWGTRGSGEGIGVCVARQPMRETKLATPWPPAAVDVHATGRRRLQREQPWPAHPHSTRALPHTLRARAQM